MGVNLVPIARDFTISVETFTPLSGDVKDEVLTPGEHRVMRFNFLVHNAGDTDLVLARPSARPDLYVWSSGHAHYHLKEFIHYVLLDASGQQVGRGYKQSFCLIDSVRISPWAREERRFVNCNTLQGISAGWADLYRRHLPGQYVVLDGVADGEYTLIATANPKRLLVEDNYQDNSTAIRLRITGDRVDVLGTVPSEPVPPVDPVPAPGLPAPAPVDPVPAPSPPAPHVTPPFLGEIRMIAGSSAPRGWERCDGQLLSIEEHEGLFTLLGTTYGGDGRSTFALPDLRGRVPIHAGNGHTLGQRNGEEAHALAPQETPAHTHPLFATSDTGNASSPSGNVFATGALSIDRVYADPVGTAPMASQAVVPQGAGAPHDNMQPFLALSFVIAVEGLYPLE